MEDQTYQRIHYFGRRIKIKKNDKEIRETIGECTKQKYGVFQYNGLGLLFDGVSTKITSKVQKESNDLDLFYSFGVASPPTHTHPIS